MRIAGAIDLVQVSSLSATVSSGHVQLYAKTDGGLYYKDSTAVERRITHAAVYTGFATSGTLTPAFGYKFYDALGLTGTTAFANPTGTWPHRFVWQLSIRDNNSSIRAISFDTKYVQGGSVAFPTSTVLGKLLTLILQYDANDDKHRLMSYQVSAS